MEFTTKMAGFATVVNIATEAATKAVDKSFDGGGKITLIADKSGIIALAFGGRVGAKVSASDLTIDELGYKWKEDGSVTVNAASLLAALARFSPEQELVFKTTTGQDANKLELIISKQDDAEQHQTLACLASPVELPKASATYSKTLQMSRTDFMYGCNKIFFSIGFESDKQRYLYWIMRAEKDTVRFVSGTGAIFACLELSRTDVITATPEKTEFMFHKDHTPVVNRILSLLKNDDIIIKVSDSSQQDVPYQTVVSSGACDIVLVGMNADLTWPDEKKLFEIDYDYKVITGLKDWMEVGLGVAATFQDENKKERHPHIASLSLDFGQKKAIVHNTDAQRTKCKIDIIDHSINGTKQVHWKNTESPFLICMSSYLCEIPKHVTEGNVQIEFSAPNKPILAIYYAGDKVVSGDTIKKDHAGTDEKFSVLFATLNP